MRYDRVDQSGTITLRYASKLRHLHIARYWKHRDVIAFINGPHTMIISTSTGEILAEHCINLDKDYQPTLTQ